MSDDLPATASLAAFVAVAKTRSFKAAAALQHVSPSALSRQVQALESHLETPLFIRANPGVELTPEGERYLAAVEPLLRDLRNAGRALKQPLDRPLRISALESFSAKWLVPNLPSLKAEHPELEVSIEATLRYANFDQDPVDVAIRFGTGPWDGLESEPLLDLAFFPVCSPALRDGHCDHEGDNGDSGGNCGNGGGDSALAIERVEDLALHPWIHISQVPNAWRDWARSAGHPELTPPQEITFDHVGIALSAAQSGQGIALSARPLCSAELADGRLCIPVDLRFSSRETYHLVYRPGGLDDPRILAFRNWLMATLNTDD